MVNEVFVKHFDAFQQLESDKLDLRGRELNSSEYESEEIVFEILLDQEKSLRGRHLVIGRVGGLSRMRKGCLLVPAPLKQFVLRGDIG